MDHHRKPKPRHKASRFSSGSDDMSSDSEQEVHEREKHHRKEKVKRRSPPRVKVKEEPRSDEERDRQRRHGDRQRREDRHADRRRDRHQDRRQHPEGGRHIKRERDAEDNRTEASRFGAQDPEAATAEEPKDKDQPNFELSGKLTEETNTYKGVVIKYSEPAEARKPKTRWRLYPFKGDQQLPVLYIHRQSAYLMGRERKIADIPIDHPSCSKQHAVLQYRLVPYERDDGMRGHRVRPYIIDLESANGTYVNNQRIDPKRYVQLMEKDVLKFGFSSREYVILHDSSDTTELDDGHESN